jgi:hypothetical protein
LPWFKPRAGAMEGAAKHAHCVDAARNRSRTSAVTQTWHRQR